VGGPEYLAVGAWTGMRCTGASAQYWRLDPIVVGTARASPSEKRQNGEAVPSAGQQYIKSRRREKLPRCRQEGPARAFTRSGSADLAAQRRHPPVQGGVAQDGLGVRPGIRIGSGMEAVEDRHERFQHCFAVADPVFLDVVQCPGRDLGDDVTFEGQGERRILRERPSAERASPSGQETFHLTYVPVFDDEEFPMPDRVSSEEQRRFRHPPAVGAAAPGTAVVPFADSSRVGDDLCDQVPIAGPTPGIRARCG